MSGNVTYTPQEMNDLYLENFFNYIPVLWPAIVALVMYALAALVVGVLTIIYKGHYMWILVVTALAESAGYGMRILMLHNCTKGGFIGMDLLLILPPIALAFVNYLVMGKILRSYGSKAMCFRASWIAWFFLASDIFSLCVQGAGGAMMTSNSASGRTTGKAVIMVGLTVQLLFFACFTWITLWTAFFSKNFKLYRLKSLRPVYRTLWYTIALLFIRNIYRTIEFSVDSVRSHEWPFYVFDSILIFVCFMIYIIWHFGRLMPDKGDWEQEIKAQRATIKPKDEEMTEKADPEQAAAPESEETKPTPASDDESSSSIFESAHSKS